MMAVMAVGGLDSGMLLLLLPLATLTSASRLTPVIDYLLTCVSLLRVVPLKRRATW